jgi:hypothetical protein
MPLPKRAVRWLEEAAQDLRNPTRTLRRATFTGAAVLTLAPGLGWEAALFTVFNGTVLRPFAVRNPNSLYRPSSRSLFQRSLRA